METEGKGGTWPVIKTVYWVLVFGAAAMLYWLIGTKLL